jgi:Flp pilus assembly pilin Flp
MDASSTIGLEAFGNAFTIDNAGAGNVEVVVVATLATVVVVADEETVVDGVLTVGLTVVAGVVVAVVVVGAIVVGVVVVGAEPALGAATSAASRINHAAAELGAIMPAVALLEPTATH